MSDAAAASTSAPAADQKQVKLTSADNEEFKVDHEVVSATVQRARRYPYVRHYLIASPAVLPFAGRQVCPHQEHARG